MGDRTEPSGTKLVVAVVAVVRNGEHPPSARSARGGSRIRADGANPAVFRHVF
jgi:hypothetical protein